MKPDKPGRVADLAVDIIAAEIRRRNTKVLKAARLVPTGEPVEIARQLLERSERTIRPMRS